MVRSQRVLAKCGAACVFLYFCAILVTKHFLVHKQVEVSPTPSPRAPAPVEALRNLSRFDSYGLGAAECNAEFKDSFQEIERAATHRKIIGNVTKADVDLEWIKDGAVRAMIYRQKVRTEPPKTYLNHELRLTGHQLFILEAKLKFGGHPPRAMAILQQIDRAIASSPEPIPDIEFSFVIEDRPIEDRPIEDRPIEDEPKKWWWHRWRNPAKSTPAVPDRNQTTWALTRRPIDAQVWLMPDFGYFSWPMDMVGAYEQIRTEMAQNAVPFDAKIPKLLWRGALWTNKLRKKLVAATRGKPWADVEEIKWKDGSIAAEFEKLTVTTVDHCDYQFLMHTEGRSYSGRGKYLLNCGSVVVMHTPEWIEPHHSVLVPSGAAQNVVMVNRNFTDLETKMKTLLADPAHGKLIAANGATTFRDRFLTPAAQACYWRALFRAWAAVSFAPEPFEVVDARERLRGVPFETFV
jgi:hypothetical protein